MHIGGGGFHRVDEASVLVDADVDLHTEIPLVALLCLVHLRIPLPLLVLGGAGCRDQGGIDDRVLLHAHAVCLEVGFHRLKDLIAQIVLLQEVPERQDRCLIRDPVTDQVDAGKAAHRRHLDQRILLRWIAQVVPLLHQMNPLHGSKRIRRATPLGAGLGVQGLDQIDQLLPGNNSLHLGQKSLAPGAPYGRALLVITKTKLLAAHRPSPYR